MSREKNAEVAEKVMGWARLDSPLGQDKWQVGGRVRFTWTEAMDGAQNFHPMTEIADAWLVVEKMRADGWEFSLSSNEAVMSAKPPGKRWCAGWIKYEKSKLDTADSASEAICLAALKAVEE